MNYSKSLLYISRILYTVIFSGIVIFLLDIQLTYSHAQKCRCGSSAIAVQTLFAGTSTVTGVWHGRIECIPENTDEVHSDLSTSCSHECPEKDPCCCSGVLSLSTP